MQFGGMVEYRRRFDFNFTEMFGDLPTETVENVERFLADRQIKFVNGIGHIRTNNFVNVLNHGFLIHPVIF